MPVSVRSSTLYNPIIPLKTTFADCENTTSEIDIVTVTIPANTLEVGDIIDIYMNTNTFHNAGYNVTFVSKLKLGGVAMASNTSTRSSSATVFRHGQNIRILCQTISGDIITLFSLQQANNSNQFAAPITQTYAINASSISDAVTTLTMTNNTMDKTIINSISFALKWASASPNSYVRVQQVQAYIIKKAV